MGVKRYIRDITTGKAALLEDAEKFKVEYPSGKYRYLEVAEDGSVSELSAEDIETLPDPEPEVVPEVVEAAPQEEKKVQKKASKKVKWDK